MKTTVQGKEARYETITETYGTRNHITSLYLGGVFLAATRVPGTSGNKAVSLETAIEAADARVEKLGLRVEEK